MTGSAVRRVQRVRQALLDTADVCGMEITVKDVERLTRSVVEAVYSDGWEVEPSWPVGLKDIHVHRLRQMANGARLDEIHVRTICRILRVSGPGQAVAVALVAGIIVPGDIEIPANGTRFFR